MTFLWEVLRGFRRKWRNFCDSSASISLVPRDEDGGLDIVYRTCQNVVVTSETGSLTMTSRLIVWNGGAFPSYRFWKLGFGLLRVDFLHLARGPPLNVFPL